MDDYCCPLDYRAEYVVVFFPQCDGVEFAAVLIDTLSAKLGVNAHKCGIKVSFL